MDQKGAVLCERNDIKRKAPAPEKNKNKNDDLLCRTLGKTYADGSKEKKTDNKYEQSQPKQKQHASNAIQQMSNAPSVDKENSSKKVCVSFGEVSLSLGGR